MYPEKPDSRDLSQLASCWPAPWTDQLELTAWLDAGVLVPV